MLSPPKQQAACGEINRGRRSAGQLAPGIRQRESALVRAMRGVQFHRQTHGISAAWVPVLNLQHGLQQADGLHVALLGGKPLRDDEESVAAQFRRGFDERQ
jgi:hypothetical protein